MNADGFDIGFTRDRQSNDLDDQGSNDASPENCDALGLETTYEKVLDFTYERGNKEEINLERDIGIISSCLELCDRRKSSCLAITLVNERGGRQRCFAHESSALADGTDPTSSTGSFYFEKICVRKCHHFSDMREKKLPLIMIIISKYHGLIDVYDDDDIALALGGWNHER